jgi:hypothetical protein
MASNGGRTAARAQQHLRRRPPLPPLLHFPKPPTPSPIRAPLTDLSPFPPYTPPQARLDHKTASIAKGYEAVVLFVNDTCDAEVWCAAQPTHVPGPGLELAPLPPRQPPAARPPFTMICCRWLKFWRARRGPVSPIIPPPALVPLPPPLPRLSRSWPTAASSSLPCAAPATTASTSRPPTPRASRWGAGHFGGGLGALRGGARPRLRQGRQCRGHPGGASLTGCWVRTGRLEAAAAARMQRARRQCARCQQALARREPRGPASPTPPPPSPPGCARPHLQPHLGGGAGRRADVHDRAVGVPGGGGGVGRPRGWAQDICRFGAPAAAPAAGAGWKAAGRLGRAF